jgi:hypothetical protein
LRTHFPGFRPALFFVSLHAVVFAVTIIFITKYLQTNCDTEHVFLDVDSTTTMETFPFKDEDGHWHVEASFVNTVYISYVCPFCWSAYKQNGEPTSNAKRVAHHHGSCSEVHNRVEEPRASHCAKEKGSIILHITDKTTKDGRPRNVYGVVMNE